jgi:ribonuclease E
MPPRRSCRVSKRPDRYVPAETEVTDDMDAEDDEREQDCRSADELPTKSDEEFIDDRKEEELSVDESDEEEEDDDDDEDDNDDDDEDDDDEDDDSDYVDGESD